MLTKMMMKGLAITKQVSPGKKGQKQCNQPGLQFTVTRNTTKGVEGKCSHPILKLRNKMNGFGSKGPYKCLKDTFDP